MRKTIITTSLTAASLLLGLASEASAASIDAEDPTAVPELIGQWTFEPGYETVETTGHWGDLVLVGSASVSEGQLHVHGSGTTPTGWAYSPAFDGGVIREKTLVSWVALDDLEVRAGSPLSIDNISGDNFDAIVYAERQPYRWMAGSSYFRRTQDVVTVDETAVGQTLQLAISYRDLGAGAVEITICRDGVEIGHYVDDSMTQWSGAGAEVVFGPRHTLPNDFRGAIEGRIEEARIYAGPMDCGAVGGLTLNVDGDGDGVADQDDVCDGYDDALDLDGDGTPDGCDPCLGDEALGDGDGDGVCDDLDLCLGDDASGDLDGDLVCDDFDNCVADVNPDQL
ncbi:MAG: hypothetical protein KDK70_35860, partial [Myxococcales bacterium]|nr:hypothetical protein [Myxococcales bacterium]